MTITKTQVITTAVVILIIAILSAIVYYQHQSLQKQSALEKQIIDMKQLQDGIVRGQSSYLTKKDLEQFGKDNGLNLKPIENDLKLLHAEIQGINKVVITTPGYSGTNLPSTGTSPNPNPVESPTVSCPDGTTKSCPNPDAFGYLKSSQELKLEEPFDKKTSVPWGSVHFSAWRKSPWDLTVLPREYTAFTVLSTDEDGRHIVHNQVHVKTDGKDYVLPITTSQFVEKYPESSFKWDLHLLLGFDTGLMMRTVSAEVMPDAELSLFSYGKTRVNPDWTFLAFGLGYETQAHTIGVVATPVQFNVGKPLPLIDNLYVGPSLSFDPKGNIGVLVGVHVGL